MHVQGGVEAKEWPYKICLSYSKNGSHFVDFTTNKSSCLVRKENYSRSGSLTFDAQILQLSVPEDELQPVVKMLTIQR